MAASEGGKEVVYIRAILHDFGFTKMGPTDLYEDNLAAVAMSINPVRRKYSRKKGRTSLRVSVQACRSNEGGFVRMWIWFKEFVFVCVCVCVNTSNKRPLTNIDLYRESVRE